MSSSVRHAVSSAEALARLHAGNLRFAQNVRSLESLASQDRREALVRGQAPYAVVLSCSDSRVPSELVFDSGWATLRGARRRQHRGAVAGGQHRVRPRPPSAASWWW